MLAALAGRKLKRLRNQAGYTASAFSRLLGCKSEQQIYRYERGINKIDIDTLVSSLKVLDVDVGSFFIQLVEEYSAQQHQED